MPKRNPIQDVQIKNGWIWSRNTGPVVFLINADARNIISTQATFIARYEDSDKKPVRYLYITAYKLIMEKIGLTSRLGKVNIMMLKRANFFSASPKTSIKSKTDRNGFSLIWKKSIFMKSILFTVLVRKMMNMKMRMVKNVLLCGTMSKDSDVWTATGQTVKEDFRSFEVLYVMDKYCIV